VSRLRLNKVGTPATPAADKVELYVDTDTERLMMIDDTGQVIRITDDGLRGRNLLVNAELDYAQRQAPASLTTYSNTTGRAYGADRWGVTNENASIQYQRTDTSAAPETGLQARFYGNWSKITSSGKIILSQVVEGANCLHLRGRRVRVQMKLKASSAKTIRVALLQLAAAGTLDTPPATFASAFGANTVDPTWGTNLAAIVPLTPDNASIRGNGIDCAVTTAWQRFGAVFGLPTDFKNLIVVVFTDSQFAAADVLRMSEAGIYDGPEIREWVPNQQAADLTLCMRYYQKSFNVDTAPAQNAGLAGAVRGHTVAGAVAASFGIRLPVPMRVAPTTVTFFNPSAANAFVRNVTAATDATATTAANQSEDGIDVNNTGLAAWLAGQPVAVHYIADAEI
jgi:hypothetical protein